MSRVRRVSLVLISFFAAAGVANASWYDDYEAGLKAARGGNWSVVVQKMSAAIGGNPKEDNKARTYGAIFINYHPYYYRGVANLNLGKYEPAIADLEKTSGPGELDLGSIETLIQRAKSKLESEQAPPPAEPQPVVRPAPVPPAPAPVTPAAPVIDPALRQRALAEINNAKARLAAAQQRRAASSPQYTQAVQAIADANMRNASAKSNDDLNQVIAIAQNAALLADAATAPGAPAPPPPALTPVTPTRPAGATELVLAEVKPLLRNALQNYFNGEFEAASRDFKTLTQKLPNNGWIWAFLGASQYSLYAFEADEKYKADAMASFKRAKELRKWKNGLPDKYFSKRIRRFFESG